MLILTIRTDKPEAELGLYDGTEQVAYKSWQAHRQLAETIHVQIQDLLAKQGVELGDLKGIAAFQGPGSFTGLRIGLSVANALADSLGIPIVGGAGEEWQEQAIGKIEAGQSEQVVTPQYGQDAVTTQPVK